MNLTLIAVLFISHFVIDITASALPAVMPFFQKAFSLNYKEVGSVIMVSSVTSSIIQPCLGYFSDRVRIRWLLPVSIIFTYGGFSFAGLAPSYGFLLVLVGLSGVGVAAYHPESFKATHYFTGDRKATGMSLFQAGGNFGMAFGPLFMAYAMQAAGLRGMLLFLIPAALVLCLLLLFFRQLTIPSIGAPQRPGVPAVGTQPRPGRPWYPMSLLVLAVAFRSWAHVGLITFLPFYYIDLLGGDAVAAGRLVFAFLMGGALGTIGGGLVADRMGHKRLVCLSLSCSTPLLFLFLHMSSVAWVFVVVFIVGFVLISSFSVTVVMGQALLHDRLGTASGLMLGFVIGIGGIGAGCLGIVADAWGMLNLLRLIAVMPACALVPLLFVSYPQSIPVQPRRSTVSRQTQRKP